MKTITTLSWTAIGLLFALAATLPGHGAALPQPRSQAPEATYLQIVPTKYSLNDPAIPAAVQASLSRPSLQRFQDRKGTIWQATRRGLVEDNPAKGQERLLTGKDGLPILDLTGIAGGPGGWLWLASNQGTMLFRPDAPSGQRWFYFWGKRYLSDNQVLKIVAGKHEAWIRTRTGVSLIRFEPYTLGRKSAYFRKRIRKRYGYVAGWDLLRPGDPASFRLASTDNDGLWTSIYVAAESFRYQMTHSPQALNNAETSLKAMLRLLSITGIPGFPARSLIHKGDYLPPGGEWHWTPDGQWEWKGNTSSDELVGHFFAYWVAYHLLPDHDDRAQIRSAVSSIASNLIDHHWRLVGYDGRTTRWGKYYPAYLKTLGPRDRALNSLELLSHLRVAYAITGKKKFLDAYREVSGPMGYVSNVLSIGDDSNPSQINYSDEELAFLSFYPLLKAETNPELRQEYQLALSRLWQRVRAEHNPLWDFMYAEGTGDKSYDCNNAMETLERIPLSTISWTVNNSQRADLVLADHLNRFGKEQSRTAIPPDERQVMKWNGDPFQLNGGDGGRSEDDGSFFLLPYWFGRYYQLIPCASERGNRN